VIEHLILLNQSFVYSEVISCFSGDSVRLRRRRSPRRHQHYTCDPTLKMVGPAPLERRTYTPPDQPFGEIVAVRIDPAYYTFRVHYRPGAPLTIYQWRDLLPAAAALVNANFFDSNYEALGLLVADGVAYGQSYQGFGAMFTVQNGIVRVRSNILEPYYGESLEQAAGYPMPVLMALRHSPGRIDRVTRVRHRADAQGELS
jgi:hypothetical protein